MQESESSSASSNASQGNNQTFSEDVKQERQVENKLLKEECFEQGSSEESAFLSEIISQDIDQKFILKKFSDAERDAVSEHTSNKSDFVGKVSNNVKPVVTDMKPAFQNYPPKVEGGSPLIEESCHANVENGIERQLKGERLETGSLTMANTCNSKDPMELQVEFPTMVNSDNDVKLSLLREPVPNASFSRHRNDIKLVGSDDDENFSRCNKSSAKVKAFRPPARIGDRRIRKLLTSKYWKVAPKLRDCETFRSGMLRVHVLNYSMQYSFKFYEMGGLVCLFMYVLVHMIYLCKLLNLVSVDGGLKPLYNKRKSCYNRERFHHGSFYKRRKIFDRNSSSDGGFSSESVSNSPEKGKSGDMSGYNGMFHGGPSLPHTLVLVI